MNTIKIAINQLIEESKACNGKLRYSHPSWTLKVHKGFMPCDYDKDEKLIEIEYGDGERNWFPIKQFFGIVIAEAKEILMLYSDGKTEELKIVSVETIKIKRTLYMKLIFERDMPF